MFLLTYALLSSCGVLGILDTYPRTSQVRVLLSWIFGSSLVITVSLAPTVLSGSHEAVSVFLLPEWINECSNSWAWLSALFGQLCSGERDWEELRGVLPPQSAPCSSQETLVWLTATKLESARAMSSILFLFYKLLKKIQNETSNINNINVLIFFPPLFRLE